ncbi:MAG: hypothetical protein ACFCU2_09730 [Acidimicrobiia bacterium]
MALMIVPLAFLLTGRDPDGVVGSVVTETTEQNPSAASDGVSLVQRERLNTLLDETVGTPVSHLAELSWLPLAEVTRENAECVTSALDMSAEIEIAHYVAYSPEMSPTDQNPRFVSFLLLEDGRTEGIAIDLLTCTLIASEPGPPLVSEQDELWLHGAVEGWFEEIGPSGAFLGPDFVYGEPGCVLEAVATTRSDLDPALVGLRGISLFQADGQPQDLDQDSTTPEFVPTGWAVAVIGVYESSEWHDLEDPSGLLTEFFVASFWVERTSQPERCFLVEMVAADDYFNEAGS